MILYFNRVHDYSRDCSLPYGPMKLIVLMIVLNMNPISKASRPQNKVLSQNNCNSFPYLTARHLAEKQLQYFQYFKPPVYMT